ncbi:VanZ family protein [Streptomyces fragilis]|uniref:VanZ family protein n=1 Tax=Streptomyces fragilis TaxID=67301 RepID=A0ABV2YQ50_9ACTN|nr:VanZ family protein [Streptomyces fragilis]
MGGFTIRIESWEVVAPLLLGFLLLLARRAARGVPGWSGRAALVRLLAAVWAAGLAHFTYFPVVVDRAQNLTPWYHQIQPVPGLGFLSADPSVALNVLLFVPLGVLLPLVTRGRLSAAGTALRCLALSAAIEVSQLLMYALFGNGRAADADDLLANTVGGLLGFLLLRLALRSSASSRLVRSFALPGTPHAQPETGRTVPPAPQPGPAARGRA